MTNRKAGVFFGLAALFSILAASGSAQAETRSHEAPVAQPRTAQAAPQDAPADQTPANRLMFSPKKRELALFKGAELVLPGIFIGLVVLLALTQIWSWRVFSGTAVLYLGTFLYYAGWVAHKWVISGRATILQGHLVSWLLAAAGLAIALAGMARLIAEARSRGKASIAWLLPLALFLTLGLATGTAVVFEVTPTICGIDPSFEQIVPFVAIGSAISALTLLTAVRRIARVF